MASVEIGIYFLLALNKIKKGRARYGLLYAEMGEGRM